MAERFQFKLVRVLRMIRFLETCRSGHTFEELADRFEIHHRTVRRYVQALQDAGATIDIEPGVRGESGALIGRLMWPGDSSVASSERTHLHETQGEGTT